ncbi:DUF512 domain-containing protein [Clostridium peptidivorans]|uniref:DUF512 domain-containing protein n=1 Tax=Clostridium peptidivorans TaxID=100174 RepID=UPI000BE26953|nr:DUF512 domain-containing protein [Clostridium peptidivorans]
MKNTISKVKPGSIAEELEIEVGDKLISINEKEVRDIIDYKFLMADEDIVALIEKADGEIWELEIEKDYDEDLGVEFKDSIMDQAKSCCNKCIFCFIDQLPKGMRETLYFKDDDSRLSFLQGNFVTLTNMTDEDINRIIEYKISPINVSVHTTNPELREKMLSNRFAGNVYERLIKLSNGGIKTNCQVVSCPGVNNGEELIKTVEDLYKLHPSIENVAVVPVGITKFREGLFDMTLYNKETSLMEIEGVKKIQQKYINEIGYPFVRLSDEFYVTAGIDVPSKDFYDKFDQLEDGVGMIRIFRENIKEGLSNLSTYKKGSFTLITGTSAHKEIKAAAEEIEKVNSNIKVQVNAIVNNFFGSTITVVGLLTSKDIKEQLKDAKLGDYIIIPRNILRAGEEVFLDDVTVEELEKHFNKSILICEYTGEDLIDKINEYSKEE